LIQAPDFFSRLDKKAESLVQGLQERARARGVSFSAMHVGGMFGMYFADSPPQTYEAVMKCDRDRFNKFFHEMMNRGINLAPSAFEAGFISDAHSEGDIKQTLDAAEAAFESL
jgi:glutamate-1-semialdehyde 2,1-aminomutase